MTEENPFLIEGYVSPSYFCDREDELQRLKNAHINHRNVTLISVRKMGKTGLINHFFHKIRKEERQFAFYIDLFATQNISDFVQKFARAILGKLDSNPKKLLNIASLFFKNLRPSISIDPLSGQPNIEINIKNEKDARKSLDEIFDYLAEQSKSKNVIIAFDEFQQIANYPEKNLEALLREKIQFLKKVTFIYSGSHKHLLLEMFSHYKRPFFQSTELLTLERIPAEKYKIFIHKHFYTNKKTISEADIDYIIDWADGHTFYVQYICNKLYGSHLKKIKRDDINTILLNIMSENEMFYFNYRNMLTDNQWNLLKAIAKEGAIKQPNSSAFIKKHNLTGASTIAVSMKSLLEKELIREENEAYKVYDVFFSRWLSRL